MSDGPDGPDDHDDEHNRPTVRPTLPPTQPTAPASPDDKPAAPSREDYLGKTLAGRYRILARLGEGGMGVVYLAEHILIEKKVAVKILSGDFARKKDLVERFAREAKAASLIGHENIINITDFGETPSGSAFIAMEFLDGRDLARHVRADGPMAIPRVVRIIGQVCRGLAAAHEKGIIHRDLKPENIFLVEREGRRDFVKILDFGLAKVSLLAEGQRLTHTGMIFGTPGYMAPEQARGEKTDHRADVYAVGCVLYELLTGESPFAGDSFLELVRKQLEEEPAAPSVRAPSANLPPALDAVVMKALAKNRDARFQTMKELALALCAATDQDPKIIWGQKDELARTEPEAIRPSDLSRSEAKALGVPRRRALFLAAATAAAVAAAGMTLVWRSDRAHRDAPKIIGATSAAANSNTANSNAANSNTANSNAANSNAANSAQNELANPLGQNATNPGNGANPAAPMSRILIRSTPSDADVMRGPERLGHTPLSLMLAPATAPFSVQIERKGYKEQPLTIEPDKDREYVITLPAHAARPAATAPQPSKPGVKPPPELKDVLSE